MGKNNHKLILSSGLRDKVTIIVVDGHFGQFFAAHQVQNNISGEDYNYVWLGVGRHLVGFANTHLTFSRPQSLERNYALARGKG